MTTTATSLRSDVTTVAHQPQAANGLAIVRVTIGAMFVSVFFENLGKGLYTPAGYAGLINYYIKASHSPAAWKAVMGLAASHAAMAAPMQAMTEISLGILLIIEPLSGRMEGGDGACAKPRRDGGPDASHDRDLSRYPAHHRAAYPTGRICRFSVSRQPLDFGVGHRLDLGTAGSGAGIPWARDRKRRPEMGH